jgi:hypothetical protein
VRWPMRPRLPGCGSCLRPFRIAEPRPHEERAGGWGCGPHTRPALLEERDGLRPTVPTRALIVGAER